jgi:hypothetical protein
LVLVLVHVGLRHLVAAVEAHTLDQHQLQGLLRAEQLMYLLVLEVQLALLVVLAVILGLTPHQTQPLRQQPKVL